MGKVKNAPRTAAQKAAARKPAAGMKPFFRAAVQSDGTLEMLVYEEIGENYWTGGGVTAKSVKQQMDDAGPYNKIVMRINSPGGDAFEGTAIHNLIRAQKKPVEVCIDGIAASSASIIAMAGDTITMGHNAMMMIHNAWSACVGDAADMRKTADTLDKVSASIAQTYVDRTGKSMDDIKALMDAETWMSADDCIKEGFATQIAKDDDDDNAMAMARQFKALGKLKHLPEQLKASGDPEPAPGPDPQDPTTDPDPAPEEPTCDCPCEACQASNCADCTHDACACENCEDCPMKPEANAPEDLSVYEYTARLRMLTAENV
jgi:ATP-dependent protease ClpP protease subunit